MRIEKSKNTSLLRRTVDRRAARVRALHLREAAHQYGGTRPASQNHREDSRLAELEPLAAPQHIPLRVPPDAFACQPPPRHSQLHLLGILVSRTVVYSITHTLAD